MCGVYEEEIVPWYEDGNGLRGELKFMAGSLREKRK